MQCLICKAESPDSKAYCGECGHPLTALDPVVRRQLDDFLRERFRDERLIEFETTDRVMSRLVKWIGIPSAIVFLTVSVLGYKGWSEFWTEVRSVRTEFRTAMQQERAGLIADTAEELLSLNLQLYQSGERKASDAVQRFDYIWQNSLRLRCGRPSLGDAGRRCISERERGGPFDWFRLYRDPIK